jgi:hypothetical protein
LTNRRLYRNVFLSLAIGVVAVFALAACGSEKPAATPEPTAPPVPTATPAPAPIVPIRIDPEENPEAFLAALPASEVDCASNVVGGRETLVKVIGGDMDLDDAQGLAMAKCVSSQTLVRTIVGTLELESETNLSDETLQCIADKSANLSLTAMLSGETDPAAMVGMLQSVFCLNSDERAALEMRSDEFGFDDVDIDAMECFVNAVGAANSAQAVGSLGGAGMLDPAFFDAAVQCGMVSEEDLAESGMTVEQMSCLLKEGGDEFAAFLQASQSGGLPDLGQLSNLLEAFDACGVDLEQLGGGFPGAGDGTPVATPPASSTPGASSPMQLTPQQAICLSSKLTPAQLAELMQSQQVDPAKLQAILAALTECGIDPKVLGG